MLTSLSHFTIALTLASSILGAAIPAATLTDIAESHHGRGHAGALWNNIYASAPAATLMAQGGLSNTSTRNVYLTHPVHQLSFPPHAVPANFGPELSTKR
jgi:hypothetical protein